LSCFAAEEEEKPWEIVTGEGFAIAVPRDWQNLDKFSPRVLVYRQGDGIVVPATDEDEKPIEIGITVEKVKTERSLEEGARSIVAAAREDSSLEIAARPTFEPIKLADGNDAILVIMEAAKGPERRALYFKMLTKTDQGTAFIAGSFLIAGKNSKIPTIESSLAKWLRAQVTAFVRDPAKLSVEKVKAAYQEKEKNP
jgi:predicted HTH transcriptional regulator